MQSAKSLTPVSLNALWLFIGTLGLKTFCLIKFRAVPVSIIMCVKFFRPSIDIIIDEIKLDFKIFIVVVVVVQGAFQNKRDFFKIAIYSGAIF